jgi:hypothetical protein
MGKEAARKALVDMYMPHLRSALGKLKPKGDIKASILREEILKAAKVDSELSWAKHDLTPQELAAIMTFRKSSHG